MSSTGWQTVSVFLSSTFGDMHAERDYLVKRVFPKLRDWCEERRLRLVDIDLRWGVTEADATQNKRVVEVCLRRIDECRPFFVCLLGQRHGWVPSREDVPEASCGFLCRDSLLKALDDGRSVTDLEVMHALLCPFHKEESSQRQNLRAEHAFFYLRDPSYLASLAAGPSELWNVYSDGHASTVWPDTESGDDVPSGPPRTGISRLRWEAVHKTGRPARRYVARWDWSERTPELALPPECPFLVPEGSGEIPESVRRWRKKWQESADVDANGLSVADGDRCKAAAFNEKLTRGRLTDFTCSIDSLLAHPPAGQSGPAARVVEQELAEIGRRFPDGRVPLGEVICLDLKTAIAARHPDNMELREPAPLKREIDQHEEFMSVAAAGFIPQGAGRGVEDVGHDFAALDEHVDGPAAGLFCLVGPAGLGKSTLLAAWALRRRKQARPGEVLVCRFIGAGDLSGTVDDLLLSTILELKSLGRLVCPPTDDPQRLRNDLGRLLAECGGRGPTVLLFDALDQLQDSTPHYGWLPRNLPPGVKLIVSIRSGDKRGEEFLASVSAVPGSSVEEVRFLVEVEDRKHLVRTWLAHYLKELDDRQLDALVGAEDEAAVSASANPLYLKILLSELRVFGSYDQLGERIRTTYGQTPATAFAAVLERLENDASDSAVSALKAVPLVFGLLAHARGGLPEDLLVRIVQEQLGAGLGCRRMPEDKQRQAVEDAIQVILRQMRPFLARREGRTDFFYSSFLEAAAERYTTGEGPGRRTRSQWHGCLAAWCERWSGLEAASRRYALRNRVHHHMDSADSSAALSSLGDFPFNCERLRVLGEEGLDVAFQDLRRVEASNLGTLSDDEPAGQLEQARTFWWGAARALRRRPAPWTLDQQLTQLAYASSPSSPMEMSCRAHLLEIPSDKPWLRRVTASGPGTDGGRGIVLEGHPGEVRCVAVHPDGRRLFSACRVIRFWTLDKGRSEKTLDFGWGDVDALAITADGRGLVMSAGEEPQLAVLDIDTGERLVTVSGGPLFVPIVGTFRLPEVLVPGRLNAIVKGVAEKVSKCVEQLEFRGSDCILRYRTMGILHGAGGALMLWTSHHNVLDLWDLETSTRVVRLAGHDTMTRSVVLRPGKRQVLSIGIFESTVRLWDIATGECLRLMTGHENDVLALAVFADGSRAVTGGRDNSLRIWDLATGNCVKILRGHQNCINSVVVCPGGERIVSGSRERTVRVWDIVSDSSAHDERPHPAGIHRVVLSPRNDVAATVSWEAAHTVRFWRLSDGGCLGALTEPEHRPRSLVLHPDGRRALTGGDDGRVKVWDLRAGLCLSQLEGHEARVDQVVPFADGCRVATSSADTLRVWDLDSGSCLWDGTGHSKPILQLAVSSDCRRVVSSGQDSRIVVWDADSGLKERTVAAEGWWNRLRVVLHPEGTLALAEFEGRSSIWDLLNGKLVCKVDRTFYPYVDSNQPEGWLAVGYRYGKFERWDLRAGRSLGPMMRTPPRAPETPGRPRPEGMVRFESGGKRAVFWHEDCLTVWSAETGAAITGWVTESRITAVDFVEGWIVAGLVSGDVLIFELVCLSTTAATRSEENAREAGESGQPNCQA
jgi:WD40 repeat protein